ncbi:hypothetical protein KKB10_06515 [Patescibacteria group bacterium]|nr:hypothetical protein [Patescibacteria group bacterium]MBU1951607.1 hypothetical protein [Patescibacteria group bacterium]
MRRIINRTRRVRSSSQRRNNCNDNQDPKDILENLSTSSATKKSSPITAVVVLIAIGAIIGGGFWYGSKTDDKARQEGPEAVVRQVISALGNNNENSAKNYVQSSDTAVLAEVSRLFDNYDQYFAYDDDYIKWTGLNYSLITSSDTEAQVEVSGTAEIVEVEIEIYEDYDGEEMEEKTETVVEEFTFSGIVFGSKKVGEEWFLSSVPEKLF